MICNNCGFTFNWDDIAYAREPHGEEHSVCPFCGVDDMSDTTPCVICGRERRNEELSWDICAECLRDAIDYDIVLAYLKESDKLTDFMLTQIYECGEIDGSSEMFDDLMEELYKAKVATERTLYVGQPQFQDILNRARDYIMPNYPELHTEEHEFADWYQLYREDHGND